MNNEILPFDYHRYADSLKKYSLELKRDLKAAKVDASVDSIDKAIQEFITSIPSAKFFDFQQDYDGKVRFLNDLLSFGERFFIDMKGLPNRPCKSSVFDLI